MTTLLLPRMIRRATAMLLAAYWITLHAAPAAAGLAPSRASGGGAVTSVRSAELLMARRALEHRVVAQKLRDYGVTRQQVELRLATLSDEDLHTLATATRGLPSGADDFSIIGLLVVIILIIVILKLLNKQVVIK